MKVPIVHRYEDVWPQRRIVDPLELIKKLHDFQPLEWKHLPNGCKKLTTNEGIFQGVQMYNHIPVQFYALKDELDEDGWLEVILGVTELHVTCDDPTCFAREHLRLVSVLDLGDIVS